MKPCTSGVVAGRRGFSLVELLVAMLLGVTLSAAMALAYISAQQNALYDEQLARIQENGRLAVRLLSRELTMAGFFAGTPFMEEVAPVAVGEDCSNDPWVLNTQRPIALVDDHGGQPDPVTTAGSGLTCIAGEDIVTDTDILAVKRTAGEASVLSGVVSDRLSHSDTLSWYLHLDSGVPMGWEKASPQELRNSAPAMNRDSYWRALTRIFYIRAYSDPDNREDDIPTLCMETIAGDGMRSQCLVEGVEALQLVFGVDTDSDGAPNRYLSAPTPDQMQRVVTVQVHLLLRGIHPVPGLEVRQSFVLGPKVVSPPPDNHLRQVFSTTVFLRNYPRVLSPGDAA